MSGAASLHRGLGSVLLAAAQQLKVEIPGHLARLVDGISPGDAEQAAAASLINKDRALLLLGLMAQRHPCFSDIRAAAAALAELTGARLGYLSESGNSVGATLAGVLPHRAAGGMPTDTAGLDATAMLASPRKVYLLFGLEPEADMSAGDLAMQGLQAADSVVACAAYTSPDLLDCADVLLPISTFAETSGTYVNIEGTWQSFSGVATPVGEARPTWKVLRVIGNLIEPPDSITSQAKTFARNLWTNSASLDQQRLRRHRRDRQTER